MLVSFQTWLCNASNSGQLARRTLGNLRLDGHSFMSKRDAVLKPVLNKAGPIEARILSAISVWVYNDLLLLERLQTSCISNSDRAEQYAPSEQGNSCDGKSLSNTADRRIDSET